MESVIRASFVYLFLFVVFRLLGKRGLSSITTFDFVLLLIIGEAAQQGLSGDDYSVTNAILVILTLIFFDIILSLAADRFKFLKRPLEDSPLIIVKDGKVLKNRMHMVRISEDEIMESARKKQGLEDISQIKYAVLERDGNISVIPY